MAAIRFLQLQKVKFKCPPKQARKRSKVVDKIFLDTEYNTK